MLQCYAARMDALAALLLTFAAGLAIGGFVIHTLRKKQSTSANAQVEGLSAKILQDITATFHSTSESLQVDASRLQGASQESIGNLIKPLKEALDKSEQQTRSIEKERKQNMGSLKENLDQVTVGQQQLRVETGRLVQALKTPHVRGRWGELTLEKTVELAGMVEHCDFEKQPQITDEEDQRLRPDMIVHLPNNRLIVIDSKTPLDAYIDATSADDEAQRNELLQKHAKQTLKHVKDLSAKAYWQQFDDSPDFVVMFIPGEHFLTAALKRDNNLQETTLQKRVIIATPPTLVALLRVIAHGWRQKSVEKNAQEIHRLGNDLYSRIVKFSEHFERIRKGLESSTKAYNEACGSFESRLLPASRKFIEMGIQENAEIAGIKPVETLARVVKPPEYVPGVEREPK